MAKATRMQNGLRCTYVVARYFPGGNENVGYSENVKAGGFEEKKVCADVFKNLLTFSRRNEEKAKMVEKEKHESRMEFLKNLRVRLLIKFVLSVTLSADQLVYLPANSSVDLCQTRVVNGKYVVNIDSLFRGCAFLNSFSLYFSKLNSKR